MQYEIRAMSFGEILDTGFRIVRNHFVLLVGIGLLMYAPAALIQDLAGGNPVSPTQGLAVAVSVIVLLVLSPIVSGAITFAVSELYTGKPVTLGSAYRAGFSIVLPLVGTWMLMSLAVFGGLLLLVIPGIYLMLAFMLITQVMVIEHVFGPRALGRSRELVRGHMLRAFGIVFLSSLIMSLLSTVLQLVLAAIPVVGAIGVALAQSLAFAFYTAVGVVLYFDIRCRKESFDLEHLAQQIEAAEAPAPAPVV